MANSRTRMAIMEANKPKSQVTAAMRAKLPKELQRMLKSTSFAKTCDANFDQIDSRKLGTVEPALLCPVIISMLLTLSLTLKHQNRAPPTPSREQCLVLMGRFDQNGDGEISKSEFLYVGAPPLTQHQNGPRKHLTNPPTHRPTDPPTHQPIDPPTHPPTHRPTHPRTHPPHPPHPFRYLVEFIFVINYIESVKPSSKVTPAMREQVHVLIN